MRSAPNVTLVLACHNEEESVFPLLTQITNELFRIHPPINLDALFIDDHSSDGTTRKILEAQACFGKKYGKSIFTIEHKSLIHTFGKAQAQAFGIECASDMSDFIILMDSDGQHDPGDLPLLIQMLREKPATVVGSRIGYKRKATQSILMKFFYFLNILMGIKFEPEWSEYVGISKERANFLRRLPQLGVVPITSLIMMTYPDTSTFPTKIKNRIDGKKSHRWSSKSLGRKALMHLFCDPWAFYPRIIALSIIPVLFFLFYGFWMGMEALRTGNFNGTTSLAIIILVLGVIQILILNVLMGVIFVFQKSNLNYRSTKN
jgi:glycosyltransferase involved in cell wall biosynthesis